MRIIHLSDIHLSNENFESFKLHYKDSLIKELNRINSETKIDLIIISGDLVDKGGSSLKKIKGYENVDNPYDIFEKEFIDPICKETNLQNKLIFIPGNHDIQQDRIDKIKEEGLKHLLVNSQSANAICQEYEKNLDGINFERLENYLSFEKRYFENIKLPYFEYKYSDFEIKIVYNKVGIALINDSWRCGKGKVENHFLGTNQLHRSLQYFCEHNTECNIVVMHHPIDCFSIDEKKEIENILHNLGINIVLLGHEHNQIFNESNWGNNNRVIYIRGRSAFDKPHEKDNEYISGLTIIDLYLNDKKVVCHYRNYDRASFSFIDNNYGGKHIREGHYDIPEPKKNLMDLDISKFIN